MLHKFLFFETSVLTKFIYYLSHGGHDGVVEALDGGGESPERHGQLVERLLRVVRDDDVVAALVVRGDPHEGRDRRGRHRRQRGGQPLTARTEEWHQVWLDLEHLFELITPSFIRLWRKFHVFCF